jgi:hypothetical protein
MRRPPCPRRHPNRLPKLLVSFVVSSSSHRSKPRCIWWSGAHFRASSGETPVERRRLPLAGHPSRSICDLRSRLDRGKPPCPGPPWTRGPSPPPGPWPRPPSDPGLRAQIRPTPSQKDSLSVNSGHFVKEALLFSNIPSRSFHLLESLHLGPFFYI